MPHTLTDEEYKKLIALASGGALDLLANGHGVSRRVEADEQLRDRVFAKLAAATQPVQQFEEVPVPRETIALDDEPFPAHKM